MNFEHAPVLANEVVSYVPNVARTFVDATLGGGGHAEAILAERPAIDRYFGFDRDAAALASASQRLQRFAPRFLPRLARFSTVKSELLSIRVDGILADLGVSSPQLDQAERGFSFMRKGPLDMRMGAGETLAEKLARTDEETLAKVIFEFGEERFSRRIARAIVRARRDIADTSALATVVRSAMPKTPGGIDPATRTFQALRIWVNDELSELDSLLSVVPEVLASGGVAMIISFHSLEDRLVKHAFAQAAKSCICPPKLPECRCGHKPSLQVLTTKPVVASEAERQSNPRSRSAKLRVARRLPRASEAA